MDSPSSVKMRVMPTLRPTRPSRCAAGVDVVFDIVFSIPDCDWSGLIGPGTAPALQIQVTTGQQLHDCRPRPLLPKRQAWHNSTPKRNIASPAPAGLPRAGPQGRGE